MKRFFSLLVTPTVLLYLFVYIAQMAVGFYFAGNADPPSAFPLIYTLGFLWVIGWWLRQDSRKRGVAWAWIYDMGLFLNIAWPVIMPYYLLKTRGAKGLLVILAFTVVYVGSALFGMILYMLISHV